MQRESNQQKEESVEEYPLCWPQGWPRTFAELRKDGHFSRRETQYRDGHSWNTTKALSVADGIRRIQRQLDQFNVHRNDIIISTNIETRMNGTPRSGRKEPLDTGVAVYWRPNKGAMHCMAIDKYTTVADNMAAIAATLDAMRAIERHGGATVLDRAFTGFTALPSETVRAWWDVLQVRPDTSVEVIEANFRRLAKSRHPDVGGLQDAMAELNGAREQGLREVAS